MRSHSALLLLLPFSASSTHTQSGSFDAHSHLPQQLQYYEFLAGLEHAWKSTAFSIRFLFIAAPGSLLRRVSARA